MTAAEVAADLRAAADVLERDGWCRFYVDRRDGAHCAAGAINEAVPAMLRRKAAYDALTLWTGHGVIQFNDYIARDADEVIAALRAAADRAEAEQ